MALVALGALAAALTAVPAQHVLAQAPARPAPMFGAGSGPIDISADEFELFNTENRAVYRGSVEAIQGMDRLRTPQLTVYFAKTNPAPGAPAPATAPGGLGAGFGSVQRLEAEGPVYFVTPTQNARGDHASFDAAAKQVVMTGNVVLVQDKNVMQGDKLTVDTQTNHSVLVSNTQSRAQKRVRGVFYQAQTPPAGGGAAPAAKP